MLGEKAKCRTISIGCNYLLETKEEKNTCVYIHRKTVMYVYTHIYCYMGRILLEG